ncbi:manganese-binding transcriptional regulator MntR [Oceanimonas sp. MB9]|uniref:manganese-binding transcriptional regulator MntR n=1 Tax=Oceanimonas sp. MB9 TaxID=2588453 RepID=UPI0013F6816C|nr:manganese-binding transcriptional regulator MntR [Oceanimonas sp. MB9]NHI01838.1 Transcriptional regulator MntR [Oceanimonas sp. MB9]
MNHKDARPMLVEPQVQASWFNRVREARQAETTEDYVELIADLIDATGHARLVDIAARFGVSHATSSKILLRLRDEGYIERPPYGAVLLTAKGQWLARKCKARHEIILHFLLTLGVSRQAAEHDAEGMEHHVSEETLAAFRRHCQE